MRDDLEWNITRDGDSTLVRLSGAVTERALLPTLASELGTTGKVRFDLGEVVRINSCGVREWIVFIRGLPQTLETRFDNCSAPIVHQLNLIPDFAGNGPVSSVMVPLVCEPCNVLDSRPLGVEQGKVPELPVHPCKKCGTPMELDDFAETYFAFLLR